MHPFSGDFNVTLLAENAEKEYGIPSHLTLKIVDYLHYKKIVFSGKGESLRLSKRYSDKSIRQIVDALDYAGRNSDVIATLQDVHGNESLNNIWKIINGETEEQNNILDTPLREILGIKQ
jgi:DNA-binding IscR family transcriptional regulator